MNTKTDTPSGQNAETINAPANGNTEVKTQVSDADKLASAEKRIADNRTAFLNANKSLREQEALNETLTKKLYEMGTKPATLPTAEQDRLDELKHSDPDAWLLEINKLSVASKLQLDTMLSEAKTEASKTATVKSNDEQLLDFVKANPTITMDKLNNDIPYSLRTSFDKGDIPLNEFLAKVTEFFGAKKEVKNEPILNQPNLATMTGSDNASTKAQQNQQSNEYKDFVI